MLFRHLIALSLAAGLLTACDTVPDLSAYLPDHLQPAMRWDHRPEAASWTSRAMTAVAARDSELAATVPGDIENFCPGYATAAVGQRRAFWVGLISATAKYESGFNQAGGSTSQPSRSRRLTTTSLIRRSMPSLGRRLI